MGNKAMALSIMLLVCTAIVFSFNVPTGFCQGRFIVNPDGTVIDREFGLMWAGTDNHRDVGWQEADWYCNMGPPQLIGKYKDWRMPTRDELKTLYVMDPKYRGYKTSCGQRVRVIPQIRLSCGQMWCYETRLMDAWAFSFIDGSQYTEKRSAQIGFRALPVRSIKPGEY